MNDTPDLPAVDMSDRLRLAIWDLWYEMTSGDHRRFTRNHFERRVQEIVNRELEPESQGGVDE